MTREKPSSRAIASRSMAKEFPASAPEPMGHASALSAARSNRAMSRMKASACASRKCESRIGCACCMWVMPAIGTPRFVFACNKRARSSPPRRYCIDETASITNRRKSVATSSLRLRPVCNFQPSGPSSSVRAFSTKWCTSSAPAASFSNQAVSVCARFKIFLSAVSVCCTSSVERIPMGSRAFAHAWSTLIS